ncbi:hypothetical protein MEBOL_007541 [Melittangium boletus DSM 14713]|uniref:Uncharacterized protein n=1 Tax=Melittangium boletus DSM 14713 TaxID=1294270 RepID=A0A250IS13_9BACT|nr:hypothetical protein MEBOL_007541 [Melittangium boletus DSM 14713]
MKAQEFIPDLFGFFNDDCLVSCFPRSGSASALRQRIAQDLLDDLPLAAHEPQQEQDGEVESRNKENENNAMR